jgi:hypothetical protein
VDRCLRQGKERGDHSAVVNACTGWNVLPWLVADDPAGALRQVEEAMSHWSRRGFLLAHYWELLSRVLIALYEGDGAAVNALVTEGWPKLSGSLILRVQIIFIESLFLRGRASLFLASQHGPGARERARFIKEAERDADKIEAEHMAYGTPLGRLLRAGAHALRGAEAEAARLYAEAALAFDAAEVPLFAAAARRRHGELVGGDAGEAEMAAADAWMSEREVRSPARMTTMLTSGAPARDRMRA